ncbi:acyltransferase [Pedobacter agri]|uniref:Acyltransferase n=1 Tax=Pedobacter agri TaxID=454586 RepID=A0A9X3DB75_9SPHI|nr:acyltransferase [Pedobacter agri]MCX3264082.1 acyltransferase [Pedobacter agri]
MKIHSLADVQTKNIGIDTQIWQFVVILKNACIGNNCNINCNCFIENDVIIGNNVTVKSGVQLWDGLRIEDNVFIGPNVTFTNDLVPRSKIYPKSFSQTIIKKGCSIGANSTIIAGITLGEMSFLGAGSVLTKSIAPYTVWYGNPAKHRGYITEDQVLLGLDLVDKKTKKKYFIENFKPIER